MNRTITNPFTGETIIVDNNCGTGAGGFKPGNKCAGGGGGGGGKPPKGLTPAVDQVLESVRDTGQLFPKGHQSTASERKAVLAAKEKGWIKAVYGEGGSVIKYDLTDAGREVVGRSVAKEGKKESDVSQMLKQAKKNMDTAAGQKKIF